MNQARIGQVVRVPSGREGTIQKINGNQVTIWFDEDGTDYGIFSLTTLTLPPTKLALVNKE